LIRRDGDSRGGGIDYSNAPLPPLTPKRGRRRRRRNE